LVESKQNDKPISPINTSFIPPFRHNFTQDADTVDSYIKLNEKGHLILYLAKKDRFIEISHDGMTVTVDENKRFDLQKLPKKLIPWYQYAKNAIKIIKSKTPMAILKSGKQ